MFKLLRLTNWKWDYAIASTLYPQATSIGSGLLVTLVIMHLHTGIAVPAPEAIPAVKQTTILAPPWAAIPASKHAAIWLVTAMAI